MNLLGGEDFMTKMRVYEYAKKNELSSKQVIQKLQNLNIEVNNHMSTIEEEAAKKLDQAFGKGDKPKAQNQEKGKSSKPKNSKKPGNRNQRNNNQRGNNQKNQKTAPQQGQKKGKKQMPDKITYSGSLTVSPARTEKRKKTDAR